MSRQVYKFMLCSSVFVYTEPRSAKLRRRPDPPAPCHSSLFPSLDRLPQHSNLQPANLLTRLDRKSLPLNSFAAPHPLNSIPSILCKNVRGQGRLRVLNFPTFNLPTFQRVFAPIGRTTLPLRSLDLSPLFLTLTKTAGCVPKTPILVYPERSAKGLPRAACAKGTQQAKEVLH